MTHLQVLKGGGNEDLRMGLADYIWVTESGAIGHKTKTILIGKDEKGEPVPLIPRWGFQDCGCGGGECTTPLGSPCPNPESAILSPCFYLPDPTRPQPSYIVLCEVRDSDDQCDPTCIRSDLRKAMLERGSSVKLVWFGFEAEYNLQDRCQREPHLDERRFLTSERHMGACFDAGLLFHSAWNSIGVGDWEFKIGVRNFPQGIDPDPPTALIVSDHFAIAQYLMQKIAAEKGLFVDWHRLAITVSTAKLREPGGDQQVEIADLKKKLASPDWTLYASPNPVTGGYQCIEVSLVQFVNPYQLALDVLEAVWPLEGNATHATKGAE